MALPKVIKTEKDVDEMARHIKEQLKEIHAAGQEGITVTQSIAESTTPDPTIFRSELRFTSEQSGIKFSGCLYEPQMISDVLAAILASAKSS